MGTGNPLRPSDTLTEQGSMDNHTRVCRSFSALSVCLFIGVRV